MGSLPQPSNPRPHLKLFQPPEPPAGGANFVVTSDAQLSTRMTLFEFYSVWFQPVALAHAAPRNVEQYDESLGYWVAFTGDPPLWQIDELVTAKFTRGLRLLKNRSGQPLADNTVRKHCVAVQAVLDRAGAGSRKKPGKKLLEAPLIEKPAVVVNEDINCFFLAELSSILNACSVAACPRIAGVRPCDWWRTFFLFDYNVGPRLGTLLKLEWAWITDKYPDLGTGKWLKAPIKGRRLQNFYLNRPALESLEAIRTKRKLIFEWSYDLSWLHENRRRIMSAAGIVRPGWGMHSVRKSTGTELGKLSDIAGKMALGHSSGDITIRHYQHRVILVNTLDRLPQPEFDRDRDGPQLRLF